MTSSPHGRRALKFLALLLLIPLLGLGGAFFWIRRTADRKWEAARLRIRELSAAFPETLPPLPSTETSKELQIHFVAAIREAVRRNSRAEEARKLVRLRQGGETADAVLDDAQDFLDRLHEGARRCAATPAEFPPGWRGEWDDPTLGFIMDCCVLRARRLREKDAQVDAAETLFDSLQLARFWAASGKGSNRAYALHSLDASLDGLRDILAQESLSREQIQGMERELEPLEAALRSPTAYFESTLTRWAEDLEALDLEDWLLRDAPYRWRWLLPKHLMKAEAFEFYDRHIQRTLENEAESYLEMVQGLNRMGRQLASSKNPILSHNSIIPVLEWVGLERMAQLRLLRVAAHYRIAGEILKLKDPFGTELLHRLIGKRMKFWSLDTDGRDDGGAAESDGRWTRTAKDIVIDVPLNE